MSFVFAADGKFNRSAMPNCNARRSNNGLAFLISGALSSAD